MLLLPLAAAAAAACLARAAAAAAPVRTELTLEVQPQRMECFMEDARAGDTLAASVLVFRGGKLDVRLRIEGPGGLVVADQLHLSNVDDKTGRLMSTIVKKGHTWQAPADGVYTICADNRMAKFTLKAFTLELNVTPAAAPGGAAAANSSAGSVGDTTEGIRVSARRLHAALEAVRTAQTYHAHREVRHRKTVESTNARVAWWSAAETAAICASVSLLQIVLRAWFRRAGALPTHKV